MCVGKLIGVKGEKPYSVHDEIRAGRLRPRQWQGLLTVFVTFSASGFLH